MPTSVWDTRYPKYPKYPYPGVDFRNYIGPKIKPDPETKPTPKPKPKPKLKPTPKSKTDWRNPIVLDKLADEVDEVDEVVDFFFSAYV